MLLHFTAEQRHGRELRQHVQARLRGPHGPERCGHRAGAATGGLRALQRGASALVVENAFTQRVPAASGRPGAPVTRQGYGETMRIGRVRESGGKITTVRLKFSYLSQKVVVQILGRISRIF